MSNEIISHVFNGIIIAQRPQDGYLNLNQMAKACGKRIDNWMRLKETTSLLSEFRKSPEYQGLEPVITIEGRNGGSWGHPDIAIQFAQWCDPGFALQVSRWVREWLTTGVNPVQAPVTLEAAIREVCGLLLDVGQYPNAVAIARDLGLNSSVGDDLITKNDLAKFLGVKLSKVNYYFRKLREYLHPVNLNYWQRRAMGSRATHIKAYPIREAVRVMLAMDSVMGIKLKERLFGPVGIFAKPDTCVEIHWEARLSEVADGLGFYHNYQLGPYRVDFFISSLGVVLECNGFAHHYYDAEKEREREQFITRKYSLIRFDHTVSLEKLVNAILRVKLGEVIRLFE